MALIKCPECGKSISDHAVSCPHCGYVMKKDETAESVQEERNTMPAENAPVDNCKSTSIRVKSYLKKSIFLWLLLAVEFIALVTTTADIIMVYSILGFNAVLAGILLIVIAHGILRGKNRSLKNIVALLLCCAFLWFNVGIAFVNTGNAGADTKAVSVCKDLKNRLKAPQSLQINAITAKVNQQKHMTYFYIDYSAQNSFGGMTRKTAMYRNGRYITWMDFTDEDREVLSSNETVTIEVDASKIERKLK